MLNFRFNELKLAAEASKRTVSTFMNTDFSAALYPQMPKLPKLFDFSSDFTPAKTSVPGKVTKPVFSYKTTQSSPTSYYNFSNTKSELPELKHVGYNEEKAKKLTGIALQDSTASSKHLCATYVKNAISKAGLGEYIPGDAYMVADILSKNKNFKEISINPTLADSLPAGCVLVYDKGAAGYSSKYGHVEITTGTGKAVSDFVNNNIKKSHDMRVFVPV